MSALILQLAEPFNFDRLQQIGVFNGAVGRLLVACVLGGAVGLERELNHKASGVRTNLLIAMGAAFFTLLSAVLAGDGNADKGRVASNIVQGVGFLGAGLILHNRNRVSGLTSAASVFVVASIGMACGAGLYAAAVIATVIAITALEVVGKIEMRASLKIYTLLYEARGNDATVVLTAVLREMDAAHERLPQTTRDTIGDLERISFPLTATRRQHTLLQSRMKTAPGIMNLLTFPDPEED